MSGGNPVRNKKILASLEKLYVIQAVYRASNTLHSSVLNRCRNHKEVRVWLTCNNLVKDLEDFHIFGICIKESDCIDSIPSSVYIKTNANAHYDKKKECLTYLT